MNRRKFLETVGNGVFALALTPGLVGGILVRQVSGLDLMPHGSEPCCGLTAVGIGRFGAGVTRQLTGNVPELQCHEVIFAAGGGGDSQLQALLDAVGKSDLFFMVTAFDDEYCMPLFEALAGIAKEHRVPIIGVVPEGFQSMRATAMVGSLWPVSYQALDQGQANLMATESARWSWTPFAMRHLISTVSDLIVKHSLICIDFADVKSVICAGGIGRLAVAAADANRGPAAVAKALGRLEAQGFALQSASGVLACLYGSSALQMEHFDAVANSLYGSFPEDTNLVLGLVLEENVGYNLRLTIMAC